MWAAFQLIRTNYSYLWQGPVDILLCVCSVEDAIEIPKNPQNATIGPSSPLPDVGVSGAPGRPLMVAMCCIWAAAKAAIGLR